MNTYKIDFLTLDGNINSVLIDANNERRALLIFEQEYVYDEILNITIC